MTDVDEERNRSTPDQEAVLALEQRWLAAERADDRRELDTITVEDFVLVGPLGFVLDKRTWLSRTAGGLKLGSLSWEDVSLRVWSSTAITIGEHRQQATYQGRPADGRFRSTHVYVKTSEGWRLGHMHLSPISPPPTR